MARDTIPIVALALSTGVQQGAGVAINTTNGGNIVIAGDCKRLILHIKNTTVSAKNVTLRAGVNPPAFRQSLGDSVFQVALSSEAFFEIETARFVQADGSINVDYETGMTGTAFAYKQSRDI